MYPSTVIVKAQQATRATEKQASIRRVKQEERKMDEMNVSEALVKAILEILEKCKTLEEAKESIGNLLK
ncbi:hypothetical protein EI53_00110 [Fusobacterium naviforme]|nr:hypothetical protein EI53_00110 [Fusobacterium naviforme]STO28459.1 Uncharacterised protein [Fusobacterium naviforme]